MRLSEVTTLRLGGPAARLETAATETELIELVSAADDANDPVLLIAGGGHVLRSRGVPVYLPKNLEVKMALAQSGRAQAAIENEAHLAPVTKELPPQDACAPLRNLSGS